MVLQLLLLLLILGLIFFLAVEGLYTALIMALCTVFSAAIAFNFAESLTDSLADALGSRADGVALAVLFVVPLVVLRIAADKLLGGMVHLPYWVDKMGGAAFGAVAALIIAGVLVTCMRLLPFGSSVMGHQALEPAGRGGGQPTVQQLWLQPDGFTIGLVKMLSAGSMSGSQEFHRLHPDYQLEVAGFAHLQPPTRLSAVSGAIDKVTVTPPKTSVPAVAVSRQARPDSFPHDLPPAKGGVTHWKLYLRPAAHAEDGQILFNPGQIQLTAREVDSSGKPMPRGRSVLLMPSWCLTPHPKEPGRTQLLEFGIDQTWRAKPEKDKPLPMMELIFALPDGYRPWFLTVKRRTRVEVVELDALQVVVPP